MLLSSEFSLQLLTISSRSKAIRRMMNRILMFNLFLESVANRIPAKVSAFISYLTALFLGIAPLINDTVSKQPSLSAQSMQSDSESDAYGTSHRKSSKKHRRHPAQNGSDSGPAHGEIRWSRRKAARVSNYVEEDSEEFEEATDELAPNYWVNADDNTPAIDAILDHRWRDDISRLLSYS
jgi:hypothetical protein